MAAWLLWTLNGRPEETPSQLQRPLQSWLLPWFNFCFRRPCSGHNWSKQFALSSGRLHFAMTSLIELLITPAVLQLLSFSPAGRTSSSDSEKDHAWLVHISDLWLVPSQGLQPVEQEGVHMWGCNWWNWKLGTSIPHPFSSYIISLIPISSGHSGAFPPAYFPGVRKLSSSKDFSWMIF
jgi:hypothetical protein